MRFSIRHTTFYSYEETGSFAVQRLRLTPLNNRAQTIHSWSIGSSFTSVIRTGSPAGTVIVPGENFEK